MRPIDLYYLKQEEPTQSCLQFLRQYILKMDPHVTEALKYGMPFFCYKGKMFAYLWVHKQLLQPYIGIVEGKLVDHPSLLQEKRARMKILLIDPAEDLPMETIGEILQKTIALYKTGVIKFKEKKTKL